MRAPDLSGGATEGFFLASPCFIYWIDANLTNLLQTAAQSLKSAEKVNEFQAIAHGLYFMGIACYHRNELPAAEEHLTALVENPYAQHAMNYAHGAFALALIHQARRREDEAQRVVEAVVSFALDHKNPDLLSLARTFQLELALRQNCFGEKALRWVERSEAYPLSPPDRFYMPHITAVKLLLSQDTPDHRRKAADLLNRLHEFLVAIHNFRFQIDVLALKALLFDIQNDTSAADKVLTESLKIAEPGGFIRPFVDLGPRMADLLKGLAKQKIAVSYIGRILAAFKADEKPEIWDKSNQPGTRQASSGVQPLVEPLTNRELGILELLCHRLSNKEIAVKLFISPATVKKHLNNIYGKLTVSSRREAVEKADALGIIPPR
jgi:LuxR family maltose regulon positive regulatory protein